MSDKDAQTDAALMVRVQSGDREAFGQLVNRHKDALVRYLTRLTRCRDRADELAQETFLRLFEHAHRYRERGLLVPYLFRIATNLVRAEERRSRRHRWLDLWLGSNGRGRAETPQTCLLSEEATARVVSALARLPLRYRSPLLLREIEGWSYARIATALGCRKGTVKSRISRGREMLRRLLAPYWNGERE